MNRYEITAAARETAIAPKATARDNSLPDTILKNVRIGQCHRYQEYEILAVVPFVRTGFSGF
jgi:hypothetical protein